MTDATCLFCDHSLDGQSKKFCTTRLPPFGEWGSKAEYHLRYGQLAAAVGLYPNGMSNVCRIPFDHPSRWPDCVQCGARFKPTRANQKRCGSRSCKLLDCNYVPVEPTSRQCPWCYEDFMAKGNRTYCSKKCQQATLIHARTYYSPNSCSLPVCLTCRGVFGAPKLGASGITRMHYCPTCRPPVSNGDTHYRRRALKKRRAAQQRSGTKPTVAKLAERDGWLCHICNKRIDPALTRTQNKYKASVDHLIPLADNGDDEMSNCRLAHLRCNSKRQTGGTTQLMLIG